MATIKYGIDNGKRVNIVRHVSDHIVYVQALEEMKGPEWLVNDKICPFRYMDDRLLNMGSKKKKR